MAFVKDFISTNKISFCALLETHVKKENFGFISSNIAPRFSWLNNYDFHYNGRIWLGWDSSLWKVSLIRASSQHLSCFVSRLDGSCNCVVTAIYAYNDVIDRRALWTDLYNLSSDGGIDLDSLPWCLLGDFNAFLADDESTGAQHGTNVAMMEFKHCVQ